MTTINRAPFNALVDATYPDDPAATIWNKAQIKSVLLDPIDAALAALDATDGTGATAEYIDVSAGGSFALSPASGTHILAANTASNISVTWTGGTGRAGERVIVSNRNTGIVRITHGTNSINNIVTSAPTPIAQYGAAQYVRSTAWMLVSHDQGAWITPPFNAANFVGTGSMTWSVTAGNVSRCAYKLSGRDLWLSLLLTNTTLGGTGAAAVLIGQGAFGGFTAVAGDCSIAAYAQDGTGIITHVVLLQASSTTLSVQKVNAVFSGPPFYLYAQARFEVS